ncbi:acetone carboxylase [Nocardioides dongxiaopingii]|uniref:acetone carboxylase n=1 Tax=Nocardioides sp. S-1144 TaxID=2582905 RepID=UPI00110F09B7|nr:acetone carboxylase [Nocardioides sp. S-1144]QCW50657.1 acetone carboxylase [Nocardioides sp. S-1144]
MEPDTCSAKGCRAPATWQLLWNNPKLHTPERRKTWLACDDHRGSLEQFLGARGFLKDTVPHVLGSESGASQDPSAADR